MCAEYQQHRPALNSWAEILQEWPADEARELNARHVFPRSPAVTIDAEGYHERSWSLVPEWAKEPKLKFSTFNARAETLIEKPVFRAAWRRSQRCLIPASAYFEWGKTEDGKQKHRITHPAGEPLVFAGLWEHWARDTQVLDSCTLVTVAANEQMADLHGRMPRLLDPDEAQLWLFESPEQCEQLLRTNTAPELQVRALPKPAATPKPGSNGELF